MSRELSYLQMVGSDQGYFVFSTFQGPMLRGWYLVLERVWGPSSNLKRLVCKVATDQV